MRGRKVLGIIVTVAVSLLLVSLLFLFRDQNQFLPAPDNDETVFVSYENNKIIMSFPNTTRIFPIPLSILCEGNSMSPTLSCNTTLLINIEPENIGVGDLILYNLSSYNIPEFRREKYGPMMYVLHRVIRVNTEGNITRYVTKGDSELFTDVYAPTKYDIVGRIVAVIYADWE